MGGGGGSYFPSNPGRLHRLIEEARGTEAQQRLDSQVSDLLQNALATFNARDAEKVREYLDKLEETIEGKIEFDRFLFGGSVAKHTYVDGLSDIDALVVLAEKKPDSPRELLKTFHETLSDRLTSDDVSSVGKGRMAVTIVYRDGTEIQLLPAVRIGQKIAVPNVDSNGWIETNPKAFQRELSRANARLDNTLVPTIKLVKAINAALPEPQRLTGYHIEALALEIAPSHRGQRTVKDLLLHVLSGAKTRVLRPIEDITGQSRVIDSDLGSANSLKRKIAADAIGGVERRLKAARSVEEWKAALNL